MEDCTKGKKKHFALSVGNSELRNLLPVVSYRVAAGFPTSLNLVYKIKLVLCMHVFVISSIQPSYNAKKTSPPTKP